MEKLILAFIILSPLFFFQMVMATNLIPASESKIEETKYSPVEDGGAKDGTDGEVDDRINLNYNRGHAQAYGPMGGSVSDSLSHGMQIGLRRPGMADQNLYQKTGSRGSSNAYGRRPPNTWAGAHNQIRNGGIRGGANAGFEGGRGVHGTSQTQSLSQHLEIPLDAYGTVLFSNLDEKPKHKS